MIDVPFFQTNFGLKRVSRFLMINAKCTRDLVISKFSNNIMSYYYLYEVTMKTNFPNGLLN